MYKAKYSALVLSTSVDPLTFFRKLEWKENHFLGKKKLVASIGTQDTALDKGDCLERLPVRHHYGLG